MFQQDRPLMFDPKKLDFKVPMGLNISHNEPCLKDFIGPRSWLIFNLFDVVCENDVAERNFQNVVKFVEFSKDRERRDRVVRVVSFRIENDVHNSTKTELHNI